MKSYKSTSFFKSLTIGSKIASIPYSERSLVWNISQSKVEIPYSMYRVKKFDMIIITLPSLCVFVLLPKGLQTSNSSK